MHKIINNSRLVGLLFLTLSGLYLYFTPDIHLDFWSENEAFNARSMPYLIGTCSLFCSVLLLITPANNNTNWQLLQQLRWRPALLLAVTTSIYGISIEWLGFLASSCLFLIVGFIILGSRNWAVMATTAISLSIGFWLLLDQLGIFLAPGELWQDFFDV
ncbi:MAG: tripartite tricarboxylate transporter TctB family protein [Pseudomonadales bacterium]|nr:tripartite tricarboxylate transporter TctB family protein [Pseudomonadales bacterium]